VSESTLVALSAIVLVVLAGFAVMAGTREFNENGARGRITATAVWLIYLLYTGLAAWCAWRGVWRVDIADSVAWVLGGAIVMLGVTICVAGFFAFRTIRRISGTQADKLVTRGVYRFSRNPQNTGWGLALFGIAIAGQTAAGLLMAGLFWVIFHFYVTRLEEPYLQQTYGPAFLSYRQRAPRYFGITPRTNGRLNPQSEHAEDVKTIASRNQDLKSERA